MTIIIICRLTKLETHVTLPLKQIPGDASIKADAVVLFFNSSWVYDGICIGYPCGYRKRKGVEKLQKYCIVPTTGGFGN